MNKKIRTTAIVVVLTFLAMSPAITAGVIKENHIQKENCSFKTKSPITSKFSVIYVDDDNIEGPWDGTIEHPFRNIKEGIKKASEGDKVFVFNGTYYENIILRKSIKLTGENRQGVIVDGGEKGYVIGISAEDTVISGFTIKNGGHGIEQRERTSNHTISSNIIANNKKRGIWLEEASNCQIIDNIIINNKWDGISLNYASNNNIVSNNIIKNNGCRLGGGIDIARSMNNIVSKNTITNNTCGIETYKSSLNKIQENIIKNNGGGIILKDSFSDIFSENHIANNKKGINIETSAVIIKKNNFIENECNAEFYQCLTNRWTHNYWSDYIGMGPHPIKGEIIIWSVFPTIPLLVIPLVDFDWHPAQKPHRV